MPSFINDLLLKDVQQLVAGSAAMILIDPSKLNSADSLKLRRNLHDAGAKMKVAKVNLLRRAIPEGAAKLIEGKTPIALVAAKDMLSAAKILVDVEKEEKIRLKGALLDGKVLDPATVKKLASLPSKEQLRGMFVNVLASNLSRFVRVLAAGKDKKAGGNAAAPAPAA